MSHVEDAARSPDETTDPAETVQSTHSLLVSATEAIRDELNHAQHHVTQATDLIHQLFIELPKTLQAPLTTDLPFTMLAPSLTPTTRTPQPNRPHEIEEIKESPPPPPPVPELPASEPPSSPPPATSPADLSESDWTEARLATLVDESSMMYVDPAGKL